MSGRALAGKRVLVVEDEVVVAFLIEDVLAEEGCDVVGPYATVALALIAAETEALDFAMLDVNVAGERVYPVALRLAARNIPFLLVSGYGDAAVPPEHPEWQVFGKPFRAGELVSRLARLVA